MSYCIFSFWTLQTGVELCVVGPLSLRISQHCSPIYRAIT
jgi:hypothetical protein